MTTIDISNLLSEEETKRFDKLKEILNSTDDHHIVLSPPVSGNDTIYFRLTDSSSAIRLKPRHIDFSNWKFKVTNEKSARVSFFDMEKRNIDNQPRLLYSDIHITKSDIDTGNFRHIPELAHGKKLLKVDDLKEWTHRSALGAEESNFMREDIFLIEDGIAINKPIAPYDTPTTAIKYEYCDVADEQPIVMENLTFLRDPDSREVFGLINLAWQNDVTFRNIHIGFYKAPTSVYPISKDTVFNIYYSTNVTFEDITVDQTFSKPRESGYAFYMQALYNITFRNCTAFGNWGVIGSFDLNRVYLSNCRLNRFDIHCYGRDVRCTNCTFENTLTYVNNQGVLVDNPNRYNQFSSFYGTLHYQKCTFNNFYPVLLEPSYHTYTGFDIVMEDCAMTPNPVSAIVLAGFLERGGKRRSEFHKTCWPNIHIIKANMINLTSDKILYLFYLNESPVNPQAMTIGYISELSITTEESSPKPICRFCNYNEIITDNIINTQSCNDAIAIENLPASRQAQNQVEED